MKKIEINDYQELKPLEKIEQNKKQLFISKFDIGQTVYFMNDNKVCKSIIKVIELPLIWKDKKGLIQMTCTKYKLNNLEANDYPECWLFSDKKALLNSL